MKQPTPTDYYGQLRRSVDEFCDLGVKIVLAKNCHVARDDYNGLNDFNDWRDRGCDPTEDPEQFGLEGTEICGHWCKDGKTFHGFFPVGIRPDGDCVLTRNKLNQTYADISRQIDLAEGFRIPLGIAADTFNVVQLLDQNCQAINSIFYSSADIIRRISGTCNPRIETDGDDVWGYAYLNLCDGEIFDWFDGTSSRPFGLDGTDRPIGTIDLRATVPAYPSNVLGRQINLLSSLGKGTKLFIPSLEEIGINFDVATKKHEDEDLSPHCSSPEEEAGWFHASEEEDEIFERLVAEYEKAFKPSKELIRHSPPGVQEPSQTTSTETEDIDLHRFLPGRLATSVSLVKENLPYDNMCVLVTFLTCAAGMLRLGAKVTGNKMTNYSVPINFYTILRAASGRKKSALGDLFALDPASDVLHQVAKQNDSVMRKWQEDCRGQKLADRPPQPVPLDIRVNDYTGEAFVQALAKADEMGRAVTIVRDEISALFESMNVYKSGKGADGGFRSLRVGDKARAYSRAAVNIFGSIQPDILDKLLRNGDASGMWARFIFIALPDLVKKLPTKEDPEKLNAFEEAQKYLRDVVSALFELPPIEYKLDSEAMELFAEYELKKQEDALSVKISAQAALFGKSAGKVLRFAGILHILEFTVNQLPPSELISREILQNAIELLDRLDRWTLTCHAKLAGVTPDSLIDFERRLHSIALKSMSPMSWTEIRKQMSSVEKQGKNVKTAENAMKKLVALGLGEITRGPNGGLHYKALKPIAA